MPIADSADKHLDRLSKTVGIGAALAFVFSVVYDWAYLEALGLSFSAVPTSISDHVRTGLLWLPLVCTMLFVSYVIEFMTLPRDEGKTQTVPTGASKTAKPSRLPLVLKAIAVGGLLVFVGLGGSAPRLGLVLIFAWTLFAEAIITYPRLVAVLPRPRSRVLFWAVPGAVLVVATLGAVRADMDQRLTRPKATFKVEGSATATRTARPIRHFERVVLALDDHKRVVMLRSDDLISIEDLPSPWYFDGAICSLFKVGCVRMP